MKKSSSRPASLVEAPCSAPCVVCGLPPEAHERCPECGYTYCDCQYHMDHQLCGHPTPKKPDALRSLVAEWRQMAFRAADRPDAGAAFEACADVLEETLCVGTEQRDVLKRLADAYENAMENDYCQSDIPECEGMRPSEIVNRMIHAIREPNDQAQVRAKRVT